MDAMDRDELLELARQQAAKIDSLQAELERLKYDLQLAELAGKRAAASVDPATERPFGIADALILIAATALGLTVTRWLVPGVTLQTIWDALAAIARPEMTFWVVVPMVAEFGMFFVIPTCAFTTFACLT